MKKQKKLYYEIIEDEAAEKRESETEKSDSGEIAIAAPALEPVRDAYAELTDLAKSVERVKFRVRPDYSGKRTTVGIVLGVAVVLGAILIGLLKDMTAVIVVSSLVLAFVVGSVIAMSVLTAAQNKAHYCCYVRNGASVTCLSVVGDRATLLYDGTAYRLDGEEFYTLDANGFINYFEGECSGLVAVLAAKPENVSVDENVYTVKNPLGGGHTVYVEDGKISAIVSEQPIDAGVDRATGMSVVKTERFTKLDPVYDFEFVVPEFFVDALKMRGININVN